MENQLNERNDNDPQFQWDLSSLFQSDAEWEKANEEIDSLISGEAAFAGTLHDAEHILQFFEYDTKLDRALSDLFAYASLRRSEDTAAGDAQQMYAKAYGKYVQALSVSAFAQPEILANEEEKLKEIVADPVLKDYRFLLEKMLLQKPHILSAESEELLAGFGEVFAAPGEIASNLMNADLLFDDAADEKGEPHEVSSSNYILLQNSQDRTLRKSSFESLYKTYRQHINTFSATYAGCVKASVAEAKARHYGSSREMFMSDEKIPASVYDRLIETVRGHMPDMYRYVALRRKILGVDKLHYYDLYTPLAQGIDKSYTYEQAQQMVLEAVAPLGEGYVNTVKKGFSEHWIDVYPNKGKRGGAFSSGTYDSNPFILTNFTGTLDSVSTIAHEMGHSMHTWYANHNQPPQYAEYTIFVAEVASTVNENLLIESLLKKETDPKTRLFLLNHYLEGFKGTVYRQTMFAEFEKEAHAMAERGEPLTPDAFNSCYRQLIADYFGSDLVIDDEVQYEWARIPHFYSPFYVYKYATGYSTAVALSEGILKEGKPAVERYLDFLKMGGSRFPLDELKSAGVDLTTPEPVDTALMKFAKVLDEAETAAGELISTSLRNH